MEISKIDSIERSKNIQKQIYVSVILKAFSIFLSFFVVRITISFLGKDLYGIWIVLLSIISWVSLFDIGIGNGLRNNLAVALSKNDIGSAKEYISTSYIILLAISFIILLLSCSAIYFVDWISFFNSTLLSIHQYRILVFVFIITIIFSFYLGLINSILNAYQKNALTNTIPILSNILFVALLFIFKSILVSNLLRIISVYSIALIVSYIILTIHFFYNNKNVIPSINDYSKSKIKDIISLGWNFFIIQIAVLLIFTFDNFLILHLLGSSEVSIYNVAFKLFSILPVAFTIIMAPFWSAFTEANVKSDIEWMRSSIKKLNYSIVIAAICSLILLSSYQIVLDIWMPSNNRIVPPFSLMLILSFFVLISIWNNIYSFFLNGIGIVKVQVQTSIVGGLINIPLAIFLVKYCQLGLAGIVISMCLSLLIFSYFGPRATFRYLNRKEIKSI